MNVLELRIDRAVGARALSPEQVVQDLKRDFPEASVRVEDKLGCQAERAGQLFAEADVQAKNHVLQTLERNASQNGPQYSFSIPFWKQTVKGYVQRYVIVFLYEESLDEGVEPRLVDFLRAFPTGTVKKTTSDGRVHEIPC